MAFFICIISVSQKIMGEAIKPLPDFGIFSLSLAKLEY
jgi:hypothetical protein